MIAYNELENIAYHKLFPFCLLIHDCTITIVKKKHNDSHYEYPLMSLWLAMEILLIVDGFPVFLYKLQLWFSSYASEHIPEGKWQKSCYQHLGHDQQLGDEFSIPRNDFQVVWSRPWILELFRFSGEKNDALGVTGGYSALNLRHWLSSTQNEHDKMGVVLVALR